MQKGLSLSNKYAMFQPPNDVNSFWTTTEAFCSMQVFICKQKWETKIWDKKESEMFLNHEIISDGLHLKYERIN